MGINVLRKGLFRTGCLVVLVVGLFFSMTVRAEDVSQQDIDSAYDYFNNTAVPPSSVPAVVPAPAHSAPQNKIEASSIGGFANSLVQPVQVVSSFLLGGAMTIGMTCLFAAFVRYMQYRVNPLANPISVVITLFILGFLLVLLPLLYKLLDPGVGSSLS